MRSRTPRGLVTPLALEVRRGECPPRRVDPLAVVDLVKEPSQAPQRGAEVLVLREIDLLFLDRSHEPLGISILLGFTYARHADLHLVARQHLDVGRRGILHPLGRMIDTPAAAL